MIDVQSAPAHRVLRHTRNHLHMSPHPALRGCVSHYTVTFPRAAAPGEDLPETLTLLPDASGCLVFDMSGSSPGHFWGATTQAVVVNRDYDDAPVRFFVEFCPGGAHRIAGVHMRELANQMYAIQDVVPVLFDELYHVLQEQSQLGPLLDRVDAILIRQLALHASHSTTLLPPVLLPVLRAVEGPAPVRALADATGYSERHLGRLFASSLGISVKACQRVLRINHVLMQIAPGISLTGLAHATGYYDQAHFNHDFKAVCGVSPTAYLASMADFYKEDFKF